MGTIPLYFLQIGFLLLLHHVSLKSTVSVSLHTATWGWPWGCLGGGGEACFPKRGVPDCVLCLCRSLFHNTGSEFRSDPSFPIVLPLDHSAPATQSQSSIYASNRDLEEMHGVKSRSLHRAIAFPAPVNGPVYFFLSAMDGSLISSVFLMREAFLTTHFPFVFYVLFFFTAVTTIEHTIYFIYLLCVHLTPTLECKFHEGMAFSSFCLLPIFLQHLPLYNELGSNLPFSVIWKNLFNLR